jgi:hypothetical protein
LTLPTTDWSIFQKQLEVRVGRATEVGLAIAAAAAVAVAVAAAAAAAAATTQQQHSIIVHYGPCQRFSFYMNGDVYYAC